MKFHELYFLFLAFFAELIGTASGVSSSVLFVPLAVLLESVQVTLVLTASLHVIGNTIRIFMYRKNVNWPLTFKFGLLSVIMTGLGAYYSDIFSAPVFKMLMGIFLMAIALFSLYSNRIKISIRSKNLPYAAGALSGFLTGILGSGGAVRSLALATFGLGPLEFVATSTLIDFGGDVFRLGVYLNKGYLGPEHYFYLPLLTLVAFAANVLAKKWLKRVTPDLFRKIILALVFFMGVFSVLNAVFGAA